MENEAHTIKKEKNKIKKKNFAPEHDEWKKQTGNRGLRVWVGDVISLVIFSLVILQE